MRIHPTCVFLDIRKKTWGYRLGCIPVGQSNTFNEGNRGTGTRTIVSSRAKLPENWKHSYENTDNKDEAGVCFQEHMIHCYRFTPITMPLALHSEAA